MKNVVVVGSQWGDEGKGKIVDWFSSEADVVVDPWALLDEIKEIKKKGINVSPENFMISESASLILPFHQEMDEIREDAAGKGKIGTTRRGIGPCYEDKVGRRSIRVMDLRSKKKS